VTTQSRQKSYAGRRVRDVSLAYFELILLKVSPTMGMMRFVDKGKINLWFIGPFEILEKFGDVAYMLALPLNLSVVNPVFHVSMIELYCHDDSHMI